MPTISLYPQPILSTNPWFRALPMPIREAMVQRSTPMHLPSGTLLFRQGMQPHAWYGVIQGELRLSTFHENGKEYTLSVVEAGQWVGESALLGMQPYLNNATANGPVKVLALPRDAFEALMDDATFARAMSRLVCERFRMLCEALSDASLRPTRARVALRLLHLAHGDAAQMAQPRTRVFVSQEVLATMLGITRQTLNVELHCLVRQQVVRLGYRCIELLSVEALRRFSEEH